MLPMKVISWNVRGINGLNKHKMLCRVILQEKPTMLMIQETKRNSDNLRALLLPLWKNNKSIAFDVARALGGLAIAWNPSEIILNNFTTTRNSISTSFYPIGTDVHGFITNVYNPQYLDKKINILDFLDWYRQEKPKQNWIIGRNFNLITNLREKRRSLSYSLTGRCQVQELHRWQRDGGLWNHQWNLQLE